MQTIAKLILTLIGLGVAYFLMDKQLFYYGKNDLDIYKILPCNIIPEDRPDFEGGFALFDEHGFTIAAKGNVYKFNDQVIKIKKVLKYRFDSKKLIAEIEDVTGIVFHIEFSKKSVDELNVQIVSNTYSKGYKWIEIATNDGYIEKLSVFRNLIMFAGLILLVIGTYKLFRNSPSVKEV